MMHIVILNQNSKLLQTAVDSVLGQKIPVECTVINPGDKAIKGCKNITIPQADLGIALEIAQRTALPYFGIMRSSQVVFQNKYEELKSRLDIHPLVSYAYCDYEINNNHQFEHPFDLRIIGMGYRPNLFGLFKTRNQFPVPGQQLLDSLLQNSIFIHTPLSLFRENQDAYYR